jgi:glycosyltransferase involved in cell wall biosynthesis
VHRVSLPRVLLGTPPAPGRILFYGLWFRGHNNARYAELLPRLARVDACLLTVAGRQPLRAVHYRAARAARRAGDATFLRRAHRAYPFLLTGEPRQIAAFPGPVVVDLDDPRFNAEEVSLLRRPNLAAYVVTDARAAERLQSLGVDKPWHVIPQGVGATSTAALAAARSRRNGSPFVVGYSAAWLLVDGDRGGENPLYNTEHLLQLWDEIHRRLPEARLWLIGGASRRLRTRLAGRGDVVVLGRLPREQALAHTAAFDVGLYPRTRDQGIRSAKVAEYLGFGIPTVSYNYAVTNELAETGGGVLVESPEAFVGAVEELARDERRRAVVADAALAAGRSRTWDLLAPRYAEILDRYLPA